MNLQNINIRPIIPADNAMLAKIIRNTLTEFGANHPGTVYYDATTDDLSTLFSRPDAVYFVAEADGEVLGGGGIFPTDELPTKTVELVKLYLISEARGLGVGKRLMQQCLNWAMQQGAEQVYLETMPELTIAVPLYEAFGFKYLPAPLGNSGHFGCAIQMLKVL